MLYALVPREKIGAAMGLYGLGIVFAPAVGPTLGGYLVEYVDWRLIFYINVPIGILGAIAAIVWLPLPKRLPRPEFDYLRFLAIADRPVLAAPGALGGRVLGLDELPGAHPDHGRTAVPRAVRRHRARGRPTDAQRPGLPLLAVHELADPDRRLSVGLFGVLFFIPLFLQQTQGLGAFDTGLLLLPQALVMGVLMPVAGRIYDRFGPRWPAVIGLTILAAGTWMLRDLSVNSSWTDLRWILMFRAIGMGLAMMPIMTGGLSAVPPDQVSGASAFNNVTQRTAAAMGLAALTALLGARQAQQLTDTGGMMGLTPSATTGATAGASSAPDVASGSSAMLDHYMMYQQATAQAFVTALDNLMIVTAVLTAAGVVLACFLRNGPAPASGGPAVVEA